MTIIVTGGAGFIGSNFVYHMLNKYPDYRIVCVDCLTYAGNLSTLEEALKNPNFRFCKINICDREAIYKLFEEEHPDIVVNFAAESHVDRSIENPEIFLDTNIKGTAVMMDACRKYGIKRYHQVSTDEVYGDLPLDRPDLFFTEETPIHTSSPYSSSKAGADLLVQAYHRTYGLPITISRCSNNYGPYHFPEKLIPLMIANALADKPLPVYGEGLNVRDWLYVEDHCKAIDLIIHKGRVGEVYNIGGHNEMRNIDIVKLICKELGKPESLITHVTDRKGHDMRYAIDPTKIHNELGWLPETKFADGIKKTIKWYLENREWWETIISGEYQNYYEKMYGNREEVSAHGNRYKRNRETERGNSMKVLVTGAKGQLGTDLMNELAKRGIEGIGVDVEEMDITDAEACRRVIKASGADAVIHCAAYTAVDAAEDNVELCRRINGEGTRNVAQACKEADVKLMYISTDYVFDGQGTRPWEPDDERHPLNVYGQTKYEGELAVEERSDKYFIVRIAWVFGVAGKNFIKTMLRLGKERGAVSVVDDQVGSPTYTHDLARLLVDMIQTDKYGRYHATNEGLCSWYEFAKEIFRQAGMDVPVTPVSSSEFPAKATRPSNSRMSKEKLSDNGFERLPAWQDALGRFLKEIEY